MASNYDAILREYKAQRAERATSASEEFWRELARYPSVTLVTFSYQGSGDDGSVEQGMYFAEANPDTIEDPILNQPDKETPIVDVDPVMHEAADGFAYAVLESVAGGWEINDGSQGTIIVRVASKKVSVEHEWNVTETQSHTFELGGTTVE